MAHMSKSCDDIFNQLLQGGVSPEELYNTVCKQVLYSFLFHFQFSGTPCLIVKKSEQKKRVTETYSVFTASEKLAPTERIICLNLLVVFSRQDRI